MKLNDYFLNQMYNLEFSPGDFETVGLNSDNTTILDKNIYKNLDIVKNNPIFLTDGEFDENKFDLIYNKAMFGFLQMSEKGSNDRLTSSYSAFRDNIFAKSGLKKQESETFITKIANPNKLTIGFVSSNIMEVPTKSVREVAEAEMVWNGEKWIDAPNDDTIGSFFNPKVLALWDFDADINGNPTKEQDKIVYHKGEKKINPITGTYYYETLNGRSIYGRDVLSGWDTLTVDGSALNKYDFFDSDDLEKSGTGSLLKAAVKVAPALIPTISPWYILARVGLSMADLSGKVTKMVSGSENATASWLEGLNAAFTQSTSDYARGSNEMGIEAHPWGLENMLNLGADVFTLLAEQRWMFKYPASFLTGNGKLGFSTKAQEAFKKKKQLEIIQKIGRGETISEDETALDLFAASAAEASTMLDNKLNTGVKFGEYLSKIYMTGITVADSYGEAKESGLSDTEAALFTLVYGLGEYGILNTNLGEHILPELRAEKRRMQAALIKLAGVELEAKKDTRKWYKRIMSDAKEAVMGDFNDAKVAAAYKANSPTKAIALSVASNALGEGLEEVSEELWFDIAKLLQNAAVNIGLTLSGNKMEAFDGGSLEKVATRYALNFVGGLIGGGIAVGLPGFLQGIKNMLGTDMSKLEAYLEIVALVRNGKKDELFKTIDKLEIADENQAASKLGLGTKDDNLNLANKKLLKGTVDMIEKLLTVQGADIDDHSVLKGISEDARGLIRFQTLLGTKEKEGSTILASYVLRFNSLATRMANLSANIEALENKNGDKSPNLSSEEQQQLVNLKAQLTLLLQLRDNYFNGEMSKIVMPKILFELSASLSTPYIATNFKDYVEKVEHRVMSEIPEERLKLLKLEWEDYKQGDYKDDFMQVYGYFDYINKKFSDKLLKFDENYFKNINDLANSIGGVFINAESKLYGDLRLTPEDVLLGATSYHKTGSIALNPAAQRTISALYELASLISNPEYRTELDILRNLPNTLEELKLGIMSNGASDIEADNIIANNFLPYLLQASKDFLGKEFEEQDIEKIRKRGIQLLGVDLLTNPKNSEEIKRILNNIKYMNQSTKDFLIGDFFRGFMSFDGENLDIMEIYDEDDPELERLQSLQSEFSNIIKQKQVSPIDELADEFQLAIGDESKPLSQIIKDLDMLVKQLANKNKIENFSIEESIEKLIKHAMQVLNLLKTHVLAARKDGAKLGNLYGFNYVMNTLDPDSLLVEIDKEIADNILHDIAKTESRLIHYQNLFNINSGQKLAELKKIKTRTDFNFIKKTKYIISILPEDWKGKEKLEAVTTPVYNEMLKKEGDSKYDISLELRVALLKESILLLDAIYDFFKENSDKINEDGIYEIVSKLKLLPSTSELSTTYNGTTINNQLNDFDDRTFLYMLASSASVKASDFYELMKTSIDPRYAPIPGLELAVKMSFGFLINQPLFEIFGKAYNKKILEETSSLEGKDSNYFFDNYNKIIYNGSKLDSSYALLFIHTFLVEGGAGTGKSSGYYSTLINMLRKYNPDLIKKVWIVHTSEERANILGKEIGLKEEEIQGFSREEYLRKINPNYKAPIYLKGVIIELKENLVEDEDTGINYWKDVQIALDLDNPTLIIFDESTRFSQQEMLVSEKYQSEFGIHGIATGDYDLIGAVGLVENSDGSVTYLNTSSDNFFHSPKLGSSMRTENKIKDLNINNFKEAKAKFIKELRALGMVSDKVDLKYYEDLTGLYGEKIESADSDTLDATIGLMLDSLKDDELINFIADNKESELYKKLLNLNENDSKYKGKIRFVDSSSAQGEEAQYYIVELSLLDIGPLNKDNRGVHDSFVNTFYTAISRSKLGTLLIKNRNIDTVATNTRVDELIKSPLSKQAITDYGNEFVYSLSEIHGDPNNIKYESIGKTRKKKINPDPPKQDDKEDLDKLASRLNTKKYPIKNDNPNEYHMLMHSMPVSETGFIKGTDGKYRKGDEKAYKHRIDGLNGLTQLGDITSKKETFGLNSDGTLKNLKEALARLNSVTQAGLYMDNKEDIRKHIIDLLGLTVPEDEIGIDFMYMIKSTDEWVDGSGNVHKFDNSSKGIFNRMFKSVRESLMGIFRGKNTPYNDDAELNKYLAMNVYRIVKDPSTGKETRQNFLTVPLSIFTSPLTMMETEGFKELKDVFVNQASRDMQTMINLLQNDEDVKKLPNAEKLLKSFLIYTYKSMNGDIVVYLDDFIPARDALAISGPSITVSDSKGYAYHFTDKYQYDGEYVDLKDIDLSVHHISKDIYFATEDVLNEDGDIVIPKGRRFVLVSDITNYTNDKKMLEDFVNNELSNKPLGKISVIYVSAPKVSISDYFLNFALLYKRGTKPETDIGIETTDFRLSEFITKKDSPFDLYIKLLTQDDSNKTSMLARWEIFKNIITQISLDAKDSDQLMDILNSNLSESKYLNLIRVDDSVDQSIKNVINGLRKSYEGKDITVKLFISNLLLHFIIKNNKGFLDSIPWTSSEELELTDFIKNNISKLEECLPDAWKEGIYIRLLPKDESYQLNIGENAFVPIRSNNYEAETDNVKVGNKNIRINGKIDTTVHVMEVNGLMDKILETIDSVQLGKNNYQLDWYVKNSRPHSNEEPKKGIKVPDSVRYGGENLLAIVNANESEFKDIDLTSEKDLLKVLNKLGYGIWHNNALTSIIIKIPKNSQLFYLSNIFKSPDGTFNVILAGSTIEKLTEDRLQMELERLYGSNIENIVKSFETWEFNDRLNIAVGGNENAKFLKEAAEFVKAQRKGDESLEGLDNILKYIRENAVNYIDRINQNIDDPFDIDTFVETVKYYIQHKKEEQSSDSNFYDATGIEPITDMEIFNGGVIGELAKTIKDIENLADNYVDDNSCVL